MTNSNFETPLSQAGGNLKIINFPGPVIQTGSTTRIDFGSTPLDPSWIMEGTPAARSIPLLRAEDGNFSCGLWDCQAGKFKFIYSCDELVHILEGEVIVEENGAVYTLRAGDVALFPEGLVTYWTVPKYVRKFAIFRSVREPLLDRVYMKLKKKLLKALGKK